MYIIFLFYFIFPTYADIKDIRWCLINEVELTKCNKLKNELAKNKIAENFNFSCIFTKDVFDCMDKLKNHKADLINLDVGLAYHAISRYGLRAFALENYNFEADKSRMKLNYTTNAVVIKNSVLHPKKLFGTSACFSAAGSAEGWLYPLSNMIKNNWMSITKCNNMVQTSSEFFTNGSCAPGNRAKDLNLLGDNGYIPCQLCASHYDSRGLCSSSDAFAGSAGALKCLEKSYLKNKTTVAFLRGDIIRNMIDRNDLDPSLFELLCTEEQNDGTFNAPLDHINECNWGVSPSRMLMTRMASMDIAIYQDLIEIMVQLYGINGTNVTDFQLFQSSDNYEISPDLQMQIDPSGSILPNLPCYDLMFSDLTKSIYFPPHKDTLNIFDKIDNGFTNAIETLNQCNIPGITWCVIDTDALAKCDSMRLALETLDIQPPFYCILGDSTLDCMNLINEGFVDLMTLDAAELYIGGKYLDLVPIAIEYYGDSPYYYGVAVAKETDKSILISNWKNLKTCHSGANTATGWVLPITIALNTQQFIVQNRDIVSSFAELVSRSCIPGILDSSVNPNMRHPISLCEICSGGGHDLCLANSIESQFTDSGAFVCLLEIGDIAFVKHFTVYDNTDGRNSVDWARNKRLDDFELICPDGRRLDVSKWKDCNLGKVPGNTVVTAHFKSAKQRENMWILLRYVQEYFSSDGSKTIFSMFESPFNRYDLMFSDAATSLKSIPLVNQSYQHILDKEFIKKCENLENLSKPGYSGFYYIQKP